MKIGLIDVDGHNFPNIPLMKLSAYHKNRGDSVEWYSPMFSGHLDKVYVSKVFSFSPEYEHHINADEIVYGGSGYSIDTVDGRETYNKHKDVDLPHEIEHIYPDYSIYGITDTAYGFLSRGCPRGCSFCHVAAKEGRRSYKVADLTEFWSGQKNIVLCDPNILACPDWENLLYQLIDSKANIDINQGLDIRLTNEKNIALLNQIKLKEIHFAWDNAKDDLVPYFERYKTFATRKPHGHYATVYCLVNFNSTLDEDLHRIYTLRDMGYSPFVMVYDKQNLPKNSQYRKLARWVNNRFIFAKCDRFEDYLKKEGGDNQQDDIADQQTMFLLR
jgi:hypothetical protein